MLREQIGAKPFRKGIKSYLKKYKFKNVTVSDFLLEMEKSSKKNLSGFRKEWLESTRLPTAAIENNLAQNAPRQSSLKKSSHLIILDYDRNWRFQTLIDFQKKTMSRF